MVNALCIPIRKIKNCGNKKADNLEIFFFFPIKDARVILYHIANVTLNHILPNPHLNNFIYLLLNGSF